MQKDAFNIETPLGIPLGTKNKLNMNNSCIWKMEVRGNKFI